MHPFGNVMMHCLVKFHFRFLNDGVVPECVSTLADEGVNADRPGERRTKPKAHERNGHYRRALVHLAIGTRFDARLAVERHEYQSPNIDRR